jgi:hypothetical protein
VSERIVDDWARVVAMTEERAADFVSDVLSAVPSVQDATAT